MVVVRGAAGRRDPPCAARDGARAGEARSGRQSSDGSTATGGPPHHCTMSRRASVFARLNPGRRRVRFPDEVVFEDHIKESDGDAIMNMLRRASVDIDVDRINMSGMTALHQVRNRKQFYEQYFTVFTEKIADFNKSLQAKRVCAHYYQVDQVDMPGLLMHTPAPLLTPILHHIMVQAVLDDNLVMVRLLIQHGAKINKRDEDHWTPLHAAAANGLHHIAKLVKSYNYIFKLQKKAE